MKNANQSKATLHEQFEIFDGHSWVVINGHSSWDTFEETLELANAYKSDPRQFYPKMTDDNVAYTTGKTLTIQKKVTTVIDIVTI